MKVITQAVNLMTEIASELSSLVRTYREVLRDRPSWHEQIIEYAAWSVLDSDEFRNAVGYAKVDSYKLLATTVKNSGDLLSLKNSPMSSITVSSERSYDTLVLNLAHALEQYNEVHSHPGTPSQKEPNSSNSNSQPHEHLGGSYVERMRVSYAELGEAIDNLAASTILSIVVFIASAFLAMVGICVGFALAFGQAAAVIPIVVVVAVTLTLLDSMALHSGKWVMPEDEFNLLARTVIAPFIRQQLNVEMRRVHREESFHVAIAPGLTELPGREQVIETATMSRLRSAMNTMTYGSLGVAGARGTGKSVMLRAFCDESLGRTDIPELGILVSAPVDYNGRDFILHLFSTLCLKVINLSGPSRSAPTLRRAISWISQIGFISGWIILAFEAHWRLSQSQIGFVERTFISAALLFTVFAILSRAAGMRFGIPGVYRMRLLRSGTKVKRQVSRPVGLAVLILTFGIIGVFVNTKFYVSPHAVMGSVASDKKYWLGFLVVLVSVFIRIASFLIARKPRRRKVGNISDSAREHLRRIQSIRTITTRNSATITFGGRIQFIRSSASQLAEREMSLPAIVDLYRTFTIDVVEWWRTQHNDSGRLVIGIDELDKIADVKSAERFLNEIKSVFGVPGCLYIVSMSEDALLQFEKKSLGFRSVFDTAFDDVIRVDTLSLEGARDLLLGRVAGIGDSFIVVCYMFSGGISRDILRVARLVVEARRNGSITLTEICQSLIDREILEVKKGLLAEWASADSASRREPIFGSMVGSLLDDRWPTSDLRDLLRAATPNLRGISPHMYSAMCFLGTVYELAVGQSSDFWTTCLVPGINHEAVDDLGKARNWLNADPEAAIELVSSARAKIGLMEIG